MYFYFVQMKVRATDNGYPIRSTDVPVTITVKRNQFPTVFSGPSSATTISENLNNATAIFTVRAVDQDLQVQREYMTNRKCFSHI